MMLIMVTAMYAVYDFFTALILERAHGPEAHILAVGPVVFAGCGPGWPTLALLSTVHTTFFLPNCERITWARLLFASLALNSLQ